MNRAKKKHMTQDIINEILYTFLIEIVQSSKLFQRKHRWSVPYGWCGRCHTNFAIATPIFHTFTIAGHTISTPDIHF